MNFPITGEMLIEAISRDVNEKIECIAVINSAAEGFSNSMSDFDVMVITSSESPSDSPDESWRQYVINQVRVDAYILTVGKIDACFHQARIRPLDVKLINLLHKIRRSVPLIGCEVLNAIKSKFDWVAFDANLAAFHLSRTSNLLKNIAGNISDLDWHGAIINSRRLVIHGMDGYTATLGESQIRERWRAKKCSRALGSESSIYKKYIEIEYGIGLDVNKDPSAWIYGAIRFFRYLQLRIFFPRVTVPFRDDAMLSVFQSPTLSVATRKEQQFVLHSPRPKIVVTEQLMLLWFLAQFLDSEQEVEGIYHRHFPRRSDIPSENIQNALASLIRNKVLIKAKLTS